MPMTTEQVYAKLKELAPSVHFTASREFDDDEVWDGDGPDPVEDGFMPYTVEIEATTIIGGEAIEASAYLGSSYMKDDEEIDDMHGYLPQKLEEAAEDLLKQIEEKFKGKRTHGVITQLDAVLAFLTQLMHDRYHEQRQQIAAGNLPPD
jgi:hypothetical protein